MIFTFLFSLKSLVVILSSGSTKTHYGATKQNRTAGLRVTNPSLYQLSYSGKYKITITHFSLNNNIFKNIYYKTKKDTTPKQCPSSSNILLEIID